MLFCVKCYTVGDYRDSEALYVFNGMSLCSKHFKEEYYKSIG